MTSIAGSIESWLTFVNLSLDDLANIARRPFHVQLTKLLPKSTPTLATCHHMFVSVKVATFGLPTVENTVEQIVYDFQASSLLISPGCRYIDVTIAASHLDPHQAHGSLCLVAVVVTGVQVSIRHYRCKGHGKVGGERQAGNVDVIMRR